jgi:hypothetical protein
MSMTLDYFPTDVSPTIKDACGEVRLVDRKADVVFQMLIVQGLRIERLLSSKAVIQITRNRVNRRAAFGQKRTSSA